MTSTTSGIRSVISLRFRVKIRTVSPCLWTWSRIPSSFHSTDERPEPAHRVGDVRRRRGQHRLDGPEHLEPHRLEPCSAVGQGDGRRVPEIARQHARSPDGRRRHLRRLGHGLRHDPLQRPLPQPAGQKIGDEVDLRRRRLGQEGVDELRPGADGADAGRAGQLGERPGPSSRIGDPVSRRSLVRPRFGRPAVRRAATALATVAHPTPIRPWRGSPTKKPIAGSTSSGARRRRRSARAAILAVRAGVAATRAEASTTSARSIWSLCPGALVPIASETVEGSRADDRAPTADRPRPVPRPRRRIRRLRRRRRQGRRHQGDDRDHHRRREDRRHHRHAQGAR